MLTYAQFREKHKRKYEDEGLTDTDIRARYADYRAATIANGSSSETRRRVSGRSAASYNEDLKRALDPEGGYVDNPRGSGVKVAPGVITKRNKALENYVAQVLDPMENYGAKQPSYIPFPSTSFQVTETFLVDSKGGYFFLFLRDDIDRFRLDSWSLNPSVSPAIPATSILTTETAAPFSASNPGFGVNQTSSYPNIPNSVYTPCAESTAIKEAFSSFRTVSMGAEIEYTGKVVDAEGTLCVGLWHPSMQLPEVDGSVGSEDWSGAMSFNDLLDLENAANYPAVEGASVYWRPFGMNVTELRATKLMSESLTTDAWPQLLSSNPVSSDSTKQLAIIASLGGLANNTTNTLFRDTLDNVLDDSSPLIFIAGSGLNSGAGTFRVRVTWTIEAVADERTFSLAQPSFVDSVDSSHMEKALHVLPKESSHRGPMDSPSARSFKADAITAIGKGTAVAKKAQSVGKKILSGIGTAIDIAGVIASIL